MHVAIDCLDDIILTQANNAKYRKMAMDALERILRSPHATGIQTRSSSKD